MKVVLHAPCPVLIVKEPPRTIKRLVFATDGSKSSKKALQFLLKEFGSRTLTGHRSSPIEIALLHALSLRTRSTLKWVGSGHIREAAKKLRETGHKVVEIIDSGKPVNAILATALNRKADLIVTGAQGFGAMSRFFLGSVSYGVAQRSTCSVLIVR